MGGEIYIYIFFFFLSSYSSLDVWLLDSGEREEENGGGLGFLIGICFLYRDLCGRSGKVVRGGRREGLVQRERERESKYLVLFLVLINGFKNTK